MITEMQRMIENMAQQLKQKDCIIMESQKELQKKEQEI